MTTGNDLFARITLGLDDATLVHTPAPVVLRAVSWAQQWVNLRYKLLRTTLPLTLVANTALYAVNVTLPSIIVPLAVIRSTGTALFQVPLDRLRMWDTQWLTTTGAMQWWYRVGWSWLGFYPIPPAEQVHVVGLIAPPPLLTVTDPLAVPDTYVDQVVSVATGILLLGRQRQYQTGMVAIRMGLGVQQGPPRADGV